ncbi:MAG: AcrB/AcrD/AcrF family protein, partial [Bacteroidetes bacterium]
MKLTELTLKNRTVIIILTVILIVAGAYSYVTIPKESQPSIEIPIFIVNTIYPGISPTDMESLITQPIERELQGLSGVKEIRSTTTESVSSVVIEFDLDVSIDLASQKVRERVDLAKSSLPPEAEDPIIIEIDIEDLPIVTVNLAAEYPISTLTDVAESLQDQIETVPGIREVELVGTIEREVQLDVDLKRLEGYGLSFGQIINALQTRNLTIPG